MLVRGEVKCLHCGCVCGTWAGRQGGSLRRPGFVPSPAFAHLPVPEPLRCFRCGGPVSLDGAEPVLSPSRLRRIHLLRAQFETLDPRRQPRPPAA